MSWPPDKAPASNAAGNVGSRDETTAPPRTPTRQPRSHASSPRSPTASPLNLYSLGILSAFSPLRHGPFAPPPTMRRSPREDATTSPSPRPHGDADSLDGEDDTGSAGAGEPSDAAPDDDDGDDDGPTQDSRDMLIERLTDLARRLAHGDRPSGDGRDIDALHAKVDEMERVLRKATRPRPASSVFDSRPGSGGGSGSLWASPVSPTWMLKKRLSDMAESVQHLELAAPHEQDQSPEAGPADGAEVASTEESEAESAVRPPFKTKVSSDVVEKMVTEAELLCQELSAVVQSLQDRREESDARAHPGDARRMRPADLCPQHINELLVERAECAAGRILELQARVADLEEEIEGQDSDLSFLRLQLRSIEVQCAAYIPKDADPALRESIRNWKREWSDLRTKWAESKQHSRNLVSSRVETTIISEMSTETFDRTS